VVPVLRRELCDRLEGRSHTGFVWLVAAAALAFGASDARAQPAAVTADQTIAIMPLDALGIDSERAARLETLFRKEVERLAKKPLVPLRTIEAKLRGTKLAECGGANTCLSKIGKRLAVDVVVSGNIGALGDAYVLNLKAVRAADAVELARVESDPLKGNPDELIEAVRVAAYKLLAPAELVGQILILADVEGATVELDGKSIGKTPVAAPIGKVSLGTHKLRVVGEGYTEFKEDIRVRFQKTTRVIVRLTPGSGGPTVVLGKPKARPKEWYEKTWFYVAVGVVAVVAGGALGYGLRPQQEPVDCMVIRCL